MEIRLSDEVASLVAQLAQALRSRGARLATAESCTGGLIAAACTSIAGSSDWFECGFVTYANAAKTRVLGVPGELIEAHGAVSAEVASAMAAGALARSPASWAVAVTGIAGPGGGTPDKPVGTVWIALAGTGHAPQARLLQAHGDREAVRTASVVFALRWLVERCSA